VFDGHVEAFALGAMTSAWNRSAISWALRSVPYLTLAGLAGVAATCVLGFEEPNLAMLSLSAALLLSGPIALALHLSMTRELSANEKRLWLRGLTGRRAGWAWSAYFSCGNRAETAKVFASDGSR